MLFVPVVEEPVPERLWSLLVDEKVDASLADPRAQGARASASSTGRHGGITIASPDDRIAPVDGVDDIVDAILDHEIGAVSLVGSFDIAHYVYE